MTSTPPSGDPPPTPSSTSGTRRTSSWPRCATVIDAADGSSRQQIANDARTPPSRGCAASTSTSTDAVAETLGLDIGGTKVLGVVLDAHGSVVREHAGRIAGHAGVEALVDACRERSRRSTRTRRVRSVSAPPASSTSTGNSRTRRTFPVYATRRCKPRSPPRRSRPHRRRQRRQRRDARRSHVRGCDRRSRTRCSSRSGPASAAA